MRVVLTGASGQLGADLLRRLVADGHEVSAWSGEDPGGREGVRLKPVDLTDPEATGRALKDADPEVIVHAAAVSTVEGVRLDPARAREVNVLATRRLAEWCASGGRRLVFTSTDLVFNGSKPWSREDDPPTPVVAYGRTKVEAESAVLASPRGLVARLSLLYGPTRSGRPSYFDRTIEGFQRSEPQTFFEDEYRTPLDLATAARIVVGLAGTELGGIVHVGGLERMSRFELARRSAVALGFDPGLVRANRQSDMTFPEPRPVDVSLDTTRLATLWSGLRRPTVEERSRVAIETGNRGRQANRETVGPSGG